MDYVNGYMDIKKENNIKVTSEVRGEISYFSINQVADLLKEDDSKIRYYTNIFNDILQIEIEDKQLKYKNSDINKLEFLINLKNKGMTLKEIQEYCKELALSDEEIQEINKKNILSIEQLIELIKSEQKDSFEYLKKDFSNEFKEINSDLNENIRQVIGSQQNEFMKNINKVKDEYSKAIKETVLNDQKEFLNQIKEEFKSELIEINKDILKEVINDIKSENNAIIENFKKELTSEIKSYIHEEFVTKSAEVNEVKDSIISKAEELISIRMEEQEKLLRNNVYKSLNEFNVQGRKRDELLLKEIKKFENIMEQAYYVQEEVELERGKMGLFQKLFGA